MVDTIKMRRPVFADTDTGEGLQRGVTGRVERDDRGNAVWHWAREAAAAPLEHTGGLAIVDDERPLPAANVKLNKGAVRGGYDPYESGLIERKKVAPKKRDLKELSRWIEMRRARGEKPGE